jgi:hypothetical protein
MDACASTDGSVCVAVLESHFNTCHVTAQSHYAINGISPTGATDSVHRIVQVGQSRSSPGIMNRQMTNIF